MDVLFLLLTFLHDVMQPTTNPTTSSPTLSPSKNPTKTPTRKFTFKFSSYLSLQSIHPHFINSPCDQFCPINMQLLQPTNPLHHPRQAVPLHHHQRTLPRRLLVSSPFNSFPTFPIQSMVIQLTMLSILS